MDVALRDGAGVPRYRHEALAVVLQVRPQPESSPQLCVLAAERPRAPFAGSWALPSGPVEVDETLDEAASRHLADKLEVSGLTHLEQLETRSEPGRDPFQRTIATAYLALMPWDADPALPAGAGWLAVADLAPMAFDHHKVVEHAVRRLQAKLSYTNIGFALAPAEFTISQLRDAYETVLGHDVSATNLQRILVRRGQLEPTGGREASGHQGGRPARLFRFTERELTVTDPFAVLRPSR